MILKEENTNSGPDITKEDVLHAIKLTKNNKARDPDQIPVDIIKLIEDRNIC